ncbi:MAG: hypothetical protein WCI05_18565 [Myxococcales bacterium]
MRFVWILTACAFLVVHCALPVFSVDPELDPTLCGGFTHVESTCGTCMRASCCAELNACGRASTCASTYTCFAACASDPSKGDSCRKRCLDTNRVTCSFDDGQVGVSPAEASLFACRARSCSSACGVGAFEGLAVGCSACVRELCNDRSVACLSDDRCARSSSCVSRCLTPWCQSNCVAANDTTLYTDAFACAMLTCPSACAGTAWGCQGNFSWPAAKEPPTLQMRLLSFLDGSFVPGVSGRGCFLRDLSCETSIGKAVSDSEGVLSLAVPVTVREGFDGFVEATGGGLTPSLYYWSAPWYATEVRNAAAIPEGTVALLAAATGRSVDPTKGILGISIQDCLGRYAAGVQFSIDRSFEGPVVYTMDELPDVTRTETAGDGNAILLNVEPGPVSVRAVLSATGEEVARYTVQVRAGWVTVLQAWPRTT